MYAIIKNGCQQYKVAEGDSIKIDLIASPEGSSIAFDNILMAFDEKNALIREQNERLEMQFKDIEEKR